MIIEGIKLSLMGMSVVFLFLALLVLTVKFSAWMLKGYTGMEALGMAESVKKNASSYMEDRKLTAIVSAAIKAHRDRTGHRPG